MATTIRPQPQSNAANNANNPQLKRLVYSKYRELLGSYNGKANEIIQTLPAFMVHEDKGFNIVIDSVPAPMSPSSPLKNNYGNIRSRRLPSELPPEPPACVQNAMMTKDKKPFTYTPGGIDLSQIKSPRMAKRVSQNACSEGVTNKPRPSPLAQPNGTQLPPAPSMGAAAMGMPFQVFPTGPPAGAPPPPPPPKQQQQLTPTPQQTNGNTAAQRKSPLPQSFEPLPMGFRPEIKIPENPMATLRKTPKPQPKDEFWVEEYRKERSKSPMDIRTEPEPEPQNKSSSPQFYSPKPVSPEPQQQNSPRMQNNQTPPVYSQSPVPPNLPPPIMPTKVFQGQRSPPAPEPQRAQSPSRPQNIAKNAQLGSLYIPPVSAENLASNAPKVISPPWMSSGRVKEADEKPEWVHKDEPDYRKYQPQLSSGPRERVIPIQIEPATPTPTRTPATPSMGPQPFYNTTQPQYNQVQPPPVAYQSPPLPFYTNTSNPNQFVNQGYQNAFGQPQQQQQQQQYSQVKPFSPPPQLQGPVYTITQTGQPPRVVPMQVEARGNSNNNGQYENGNNGYARGPVSQSPAVFTSDPRTLQHQQSWGNGTPNQSRSFRVLQKITDTLVDQGDDDNGTHNETLEDQPAQLQQPQYSRPLQFTDMNENQLRRLQLNEHDRALMNRVKNQVDEEQYLHSVEDPRYRGGAIPSKAFRYLQTMTDGGPNSIEAPINRNNARFVQQKSAYEQRDENTQYIPPSEQQVHEPKKYTGSSIPSRSFKILQQMTQPENAADNYTSDIEDKPNLVNTNNTYPQPPPYPYPYPPSPYPYPYYDPAWQQCYPDPTNGHPYQAYPPPPTQYPPDPRYFGYPYHPYFYGYPPPHGYIDPRRVDYTSESDNGNVSETESRASSTRTLTGYRSDSETRSIPRNPPRIVVTPTPEDEAIYRVQNAQLADDAEARETLGLLSQKLSTFNKQEDQNNRNNQKNLKKYVGEKGKIAAEMLNNSDDEEDDHVVSIIDNTHPSLSPEKKVSQLDEPSAQNFGLQTLRSVTDISKYNESGSDSDTEESDTDTEKEEPAIRNGHAEDEENAADASEVESDHLPHQLSIIFEENESIKSLGRRDSLISNGSTISDCSTTIANETDDSDTEELSKQVKVAEIAKTDSEESEDDDDEESVSISVRLPLRLSFSRSLSNHEETVATVTVGHSEIKDTDSSSSISRRNSNPKSSSSSSLSPKTTEPEKSSSFSTLQPKAAIKIEETVAENDNEVCVTLSIPSTRANSVDRRGSSSMSVERSFSLVETNVNNDMESDSEVSVSISLPLRRNKFSGACLNLGSSDNAKSPKLIANQNEGDNTEDDGELSDDYTTDDDVEDEEIREIEDSNSPTTMARSSVIMKNESYEQMCQPCSLFMEEPPKTNGHKAVVDKKSTSESEYETETDEEVEEEEKVEETPKPEPTKISRIKSKDSIIASLEGFKLQTIINSDFMNGFKPVSPIKSVTKDTLPQETVSGSSSEYESDSDDESEEKPAPSKKSPSEWPSGRSPDTQPRKSSTAETVIEKSWLRKNSSTDSTSASEWSRKKSCDTLQVNSEWTRKNSIAEVKDESPVDERLQKSSSPIESEWARKSSDNETIAETVETVDREWQSETSNKLETIFSSANSVTTKHFKFNLVNHSITPPKLALSPEPEEKASSDEEETDIEASESEDNEPIEDKKKEHSPAKETGTKEPSPAIEPEKKNSSAAKETKPEEQELKVESEESEEESDSDESEEEEAVVAHSSDARNGPEMAPSMFKPIMRNPYSDDDIANTRNQLQSLVTAYRSDSVSRSERNSAALPENIDFTNEISTVALKKINVERKEPVKHKSNGILDAFKVAENEQEVKVSVRDKISVFEATSRQNSVTPTRQFTRAESCTPSTQQRFKIHPSISDTQPPDHVILRAKSMTPTNHQRGSLDNKLNNRFTSAKKIVRRLERQNSLPPQKLEVRETPKLAYRHSFHDKVEESTSNDSLVQEPPTKPRKTLGDHRKEWRLSSSHSSSHKSSFECESEVDEDSGVNSDLSKHINEPETDSENFPELRKLSHYQRAATHSRLFKLLQGECEAEDLLEAEIALQTQAPVEEVLVRRPKKIVHNVSVARRQNPDIVKDAETMEARRQRLSLPLVHQNSSGIESMSSSPSSPVNEKLAAELVQSMLMKSKGKAFRNIPIEKLQAAALKILQEDLETRSQDSLSSRESFTTVDSTPALTPLEFKTSYSDYYDTWNANGDPNDSPFDIIPSKAFKTLQDQAIYNGAQKAWSARCSRVLSSKTINKDLKRLSEVRESESPEPQVRSPSRSISKNSNNKSTTPMSGDPPSSYHRSSSYNHAS